MNKFTKQCVAAFASLAMAGTLCVAGAVAVNSSAWAEGTCNNGAPWSDACKAQTGSIKITKYKDEDKNGKQTKSTPVKGAKFKVTPVTKLGTDALDLKNYADWQKVAAKITTLNATPNTTDTSVISFGTAIQNAASQETDKSLFVTGQDGVATISQLPIGLYKVEEVSAPDGYEKLPNPFFMTIPEITRGDDAKDNTYTYNVTVDPKNVYNADAIQKEAITTGMVGAGDELPYTLTAAVRTTSYTDVDKLTKDDLIDYAVWDDALESAYNVTTGAIQSVKIGDTKLTEGKNADYEASLVEHKDNDATSPEAGRKRILIKFTDAGLTKIAKALSDNAKSKDNPHPAVPKITVEFKFTLKADAPVDGFQNKYGFQTGHSKDQPKPNPTNPNPGETSKVTLVKFAVKKVDGTNTATLLGGAKFAVFADKEKAKACAADAARSAAKCQNVATKGLVKKDNNEVLADGLEGAQKGTDNTSGLTGAFEVKVGQDFYVVETQAPSGYALSPAVETVNIPTTYAKSTNYVNKVFEYEFKDLPTKGNILNWFKLPKTGAAGVAIFALAGMCLVAAGIFVFMRNRKKEEQEA
ncbi:LPXTG-motif protein cell wall anchor domain protein [Gardnerella vaginalis]|uniref:LPXTG-motif protein cell wall anchor domain protein n=1 Tax=Gardnerella vaginalis TaxID=2702 RepID=A0A135ZC96_GARVA|nr:SpaH/EbpB family LPXTG-anchored major pilin [Gardnerella vaginalis]KXI19172.1 LPXTG-motif protein cell wall anchor domain protein [Gardnerella vaginalis]